MKNVKEKVRNIVSKDFYEFINSFDLKNSLEFIEKSKKQKIFFEENRVLYLEVEETLKKIHDKGIKNIVITDNENGKNWVRENILKRFKINEFIDLVITSKEAQVSKPDPLIFDFALNKFCLEKDEVFFVAHDKDEVDGAEKIGIKTIEFNNYLNSKTKRSYKIHKFSELSNLS